MVCRCRYPAGALEHKSNVQEQKSSAANVAGIQAAINAGRSIKEWLQGDSKARSIPSALVTMVGLPPSIAATAEFVVPRSIPTTCER